MNKHFWSRPSRKKTSRFALLGFLAFGLIASFMISSCNKNVETSKSSGMSTEEGKRLEKRVQDFYGRMVEIQNRRSANKNAKVTDNVYISVDSAEFLIEASYNYYVASTDDDSSEVVFNGFSFTAPIPNDSILSETEVATYMQQIKDSIMAVYDTISSNKRLGLFSLEILHTNGTYTATFEVDYSVLTIQVPAPLSPTIPGNANDAWAILNSYCTGSPFYINFTSRYGMSSVHNAYYYGTAALTFSNPTGTPPWTPAPNLSGLNCSNHGAAFTLRQYGISNYKSTYGAPPTGKWLINITRTTDGVGANSNITFDYNTTYQYGSGVSSSTPGYVPSEQYYTRIDNTSSGYSTANVNFYAHWPNKAMMNFYLGFIPGRIDNELTTKCPGASFCDFQDCIPMGQFL